jgi:hypothetical protein
MAVSVGQLPVALTKGSFARTCLPRQRPHFMITEDPTHCNVRILRGIQIARRPAPGAGTRRRWWRHPGLLVHRVLVIHVAGQLKLKGGMLHVKVPAQAFLEPVEYHPAAAVGQDLRLDDDMRG